MAVGFRHAASTRDIEVVVAGKRVRVLSYGPSEDPGMDQVTVSIPPSMRGVADRSDCAREWTPSQRRANSHRRIMRALPIALLLASALSAESGVFYWQLPKGFPKPLVPPE